jgi:hypothetical protein
VCLEGGVRGVLVQMAASSSSSEFEWGESYELMCFRGVWYGLYDCVHVRSLAEEPHVGKIMRLYEEDGKRKMRVRWFLRSGELPLSESKELSARDKKELFIAQGSVKGVENVNLVVRLGSNLHVSDSTSCLSLFSSAVESWLLMLFLLLWCRKLLLGK